MAEEQKGTYETNEERAAAFKEFRAEDREQLEHHKEEDARI